MLLLKEKKEEYTNDKNPKGKDIVVLEEVRLYIAVK